MRSYLTHRPLKRPSLTGMPSCASTPPDASSRPRAQAYAAANPTLNVAPHTPSLPRSTTACCPILT